MEYYQRAAGILQPLDEESIMSNHVSPTIETRPGESKSGVESIANEPSLSLNVPLVDLFLSLRIPRADALACKEKRVHNTFLCSSHFLISQHNPCYLVLLH
jgi:hypothetical protein